MFISKSSYNAAIEEACLAGERELRSRMLTTPAPKPSYAVHYDVNYFADSDPKQILEVSRLFKYDDMDRAFQAVEALKENNRIELPARPENPNTTIEGFFELMVPKKNIVFRDIWIETE